MPAKSKAQQRLFGMVHAYQKGELENPSEEVKDIAKSISKKDAKDFASTKTKKLPNHVKKTNESLKFTENEIHHMVSECVKLIMENKKVVDNIIIYDDGNDLTDKHGDEIFLEEIIDRINRAAMDIKIDYNDAEGYYRLDFNACGEHPSVIRSAFETVVDYLNEMDGLNYDFETPLNENVAIDDKDIKEYQECYEILVTEIENLEKMYRPDLVALAIKDISEFYQRNS